MRPANLLALPLTATLALAATARGDDAPAPEPPKGTLVIAGGSLRYDNDDVWTRIVSAAGGEGASVAVMPFASSSPEKTGAEVAAVLRKYGASPFLVGREPTPEEIERVARAGGVFFTGGEQRRIVAALLDAKGRPNAAGEAVWAVYRRGGVIAGTSAGAAVMSRVMYRDAEWVLRTLTDGVRLGQEIDRGLGFLDGEWFIDQHAIIRGRFGRCLVAMRDQQLQYGLAVDEDTALVVRTPPGRKNPLAKVVGYSGALLVDLSRAQCDAAHQCFNLRDVRLSYLDRDDVIDLRTREITPSRFKTSENGEKLDPGAPGFIPYPYQQPLFTNDILGNSTVVELMAKLMQTDQPEAVGLAFDGRATQERIPGFRFRLYRGPDSVGWYSGERGDASYTLLNIHLDVEPIEIRGPLYLQPAAVATGAAEKPEAGQPSE